MAFLSLPRDPVPAWVKIDLQLHQPYRTLLGFGRLRCDWCGGKWGRHGCPSRESAARLFVHTASRPQQEAALAAEEITPADLTLRPRRPAPDRPTGRHRRNPGPGPETGPPLELSPRPRPQPDRPVHRRLAGVGA